MGYENVQPAEIVAITSPKRITSDNKTINTQCSSLYTRLYVFKPFEYLYDIGVGTAGAWLLSTQSFSI